MKELKYFIQNDKWPILTITFLILIFNIQAINLDFLIQDDYAYAGRVLKWGFEWSKLFERDLLTPMINYVLVNIMVYSPALSRLLLILLFMIPSSLLLFYIYTKKFNISRSIALLAVVAPQIHPGQNLIPAFINGSYTVYNLLINSIIICYILSLKDHTHKKNKFWVLLVLLIVSVEVSETSLFLFPSHFFLILLIWVSNRNLKFLLYSTASFIVAGSYRLIKTLSFPAGANNVTGTSFSENLARIKSTFLFQSNLPYIFKKLNLFSGTEILLIILALLALGSVLFIKRANPKISSWKQLDVTHPVAILLYALIWSICSLLPFIFISPWYASRHAYIAGFGISLFAYFLFLRPIQGNMSKDKIINIALAVVLLIYQGTLRNNSLEPSYKSSSQFHETFKTIIQNLDLEKNAQVVLTSNNHLRTNSYFHWSSGYLKYITKSPDLDGLIGEEVFNYDPFRPYVWGSNGQKMYGLDINRPTYLYRAKAQDIQEIFYFFRWLGTESFPHWQIYEVSKNDRIPHLVAQQTSIVYKKSEILKALDEKAISVEKILWLNPNELPIE